MNILTKVFQQQSEEFDKLADETLPISELSGELLERAIGTMNYQLKISLGREPITSPNDAILLTDEDVKQINKIIKDKLKSRNKETVVAILETMKDWAENRELNLDANDAYFAKGFNLLRNELSSLLSSTLTEIFNLGKKTK